MLSEQASTFVVRACGASLRLGSRRWCDDSRESGYPQASRGGFASAEWTMYCVDGRGGRRCHGSRPTTSHPQTGRPVSLNGNRTRRSRWSPKPPPRSSSAACPSTAWSSPSVQNQPMRLVRGGRMAIPDVLVIGPAGRGSRRGRRRETHHKRWAADRSRDYLLEDSGIPTYRIAVEGVADPAQVEALVARVLRGALLGEWHEYPSSGSGSSTGRRDAR